MGFRGLQVGYGLGMVLHVRGLLWVVGMWPACQTTCSIVLMSTLWPGARCCVGSLMSNGRDAYRIWIEHFISQDRDRGFDDDNEWRLLCSWMWWHVVWCGVSRRSRGTSFWLLWWWRWQVTSIKFSRAVKTWHSAGYFRCLLFYQCYIWEDR
jgi:hypothetical protein